MPTVLRCDGFRFEIIPGDHEPPHVHVYRGGGEVKIELEPLRIKRPRGMTQLDVARARRLTLEHLATLLAAWEKINGR